MALWTSINWLGSNLGRCEGARTCRTTKKNKKHEASSCQMLSLKVLNIDYIFKSLRLFLLPNMLPGALIASAGWAEVPTNTQPDGNSCSFKETFTFFSASNFYI